MNSGSMWTDRFSLIHVKIKKACCVLWTTKESSTMFEAFTGWMLQHFCCTWRPCAVSSAHCVHTQREVLIQWWSLRRETQDQDKPWQTITCGGITPPQMTRISGLFSFRSSLTSSGTRVLCPAASVLTPTQWTSASTACWATSRGVCSPEWVKKIQKQRNQPTHYSGGSGKLWI